MFFRRAGVERFLTLSTASPIDGRRLGKTLLTSRPTIIRMRLLTSVFDVSTAPATVPSRRTVTVWLISKTSFSRCEM